MSAGCGNATLLTPWPESAKASDPSGNIRRLPSGSRTCQLPARREVRTIATNPPKGDGHRNSAVRGRSQFQTPSGNWAKRDTATGRIMDVKQNGAPFKGVRREK